MRKIVEKYANVTGKMQKYSEILLKLYLKTHFKSLPENILRHLSGVDPLLKDTVNQKSRPVFENSDHIS